MNAPPVIELSVGGATLSAARPPPLPPQGLQAGGRGPPVIDSPPVSLGREGVPAPVPDAVLEQEMISGCLAGPVVALAELQRQAKLYSNRGLLCVGVMVFLWFSFSASLSLVGNLRGHQHAMVAGVIVVLLIHASVGGVALVRCCESFSRSSQAKAKYRSDYKETIFPAAIRLLNPTFEYRPSWGIPQQRFLDSRLFLHPLERYSSDEYVQGSQGATAFALANVRSDYRVPRTVETGKDCRPLFHGLCFIADFNKHFAAPVLVLAKDGEPLGLMTSLLDKWGCKRGKIVHLEDPEFEREFTVHAEDEVEVRYLLTPGLMQRILELKRTWGRRVFLSFLQENLYVALEGAESQFVAPDPAYPACAIAPIQDFLNQVRRVLSLIDALNLNTRIWSKR